VVDTPAAPSAPAVPEIVEPPLAPGLLGELQAVARHLDKLEREDPGGISSGHELWMARLPQWMFPVRGGERVPVDAARRAELRALASTPTLDSRLRGLALRVLAGDHDLDDLPFLERLLDAAEPAGAEPVALPTQAGLVIRWTPRTLGETALDQIVRITGASFHTADDYRAWRRSTPDPKRTLAYWEGTLDRDGNETRRARLGALLHDDPDMFLRVVLTQKSGNTHQGWWDEQEVVGALRAHLGPRTLLRFLARGRAWPELGDEGRFDSFAQWILDHEAALFDARDGAGLLALWRSHGRSFPSVHAQAKLALAAARSNPAARGRIVEATLRYVGGDRDLLVEDLVAHDLDSSFPRIQRMFQKPEPAEGSFEIRAGILAGIAALGPAARLRLKQLVTAPPFVTDSSTLAWHLRRAAMATGAPDLAPACDHTSAPESKGHRPSDEENARAERAQRECVAAVPSIVAWLAALP
jgi:hypothetical protein